MNIKELLVYDAEIGRFRWLKTDVANRRAAGALVGSVRNGQIRYCINGTDYKHQQLLELLVPNLLSNELLFVADLMMLEGDEAMAIVENIRKINPAAYQQWKAAFKLES